MTNLVTVGSCGNHKKYDSVAFEEQLLVEFEMRNFESLIVSDEARMTWLQCSVPLQAKEQLLMAKVDLPLMDKFDTRRAQINPEALNGRVTRVGDVLDEKLHDEMTTIDAREKFPLTSTTLLVKVDR